MVPQSSTWSRSVKSWSPSRSLRLPRPVRHNETSCPPTSHSGFQPGRDQEEEGDPADDGENPLTIVGPRFVRLLKLCFYNSHCQQRRNEDGRRKLPSFSGVARHEVGNQCSADHIDENWCHEHQPPLPFHPFVAEIRDYGLPVRIVGKHLSGRQNEGEAGRDRRARADHEPVTGEIDRHRDIDHPHAGALASAVALAASL